MKKLALILVPLLAASILATPAQKRVKQNTPADFPTLIESAKQTWEAGDYGQCAGRLREALALCMVKRSEAILAVLPAAPEGYVAEADRSMEQAANNPMMGALAASVGNVVIQNYRGPEAIKVTITADSPLVGMVSMWITNPAMLDENSELIEYGQHTAVLEKTNRDRARKLTILINGAHICEVTYQGAREDFLFELFDQAAVDALAGVLGQ